MALDEQKKLQESRGEKVKKKIIKPFRSLSVIRYRGNVEELNYRNIEDQ